VHLRGKDESAFVDSIKLLHIWYTTLDKQSLADDRPAWSASFWGQTVGRAFAHSLLRLNIEGLLRPDRYYSYDTEISARHVTACAVSFSRTKRKTI
jgi:hypothetical protein